MLQFRARSIFAGIAFSLLYGDFGAERGYSHEPTSGEDTATVITAEEDRVIAALPVVPPDLNRKYALKVEPSKNVTAVYTCKIHAPRLSATNWIFFAAVPPNLTGQRLSRATMPPAGTAVADLSPLRRPLLRAEVAARNDSQRRDAAVEARYEVELLRRRLVAAGKERSAVPNLTAGQRRLALRPAGLCDYTKGSFQDWMARRGLTRGAKEGEVDFGRRVFQFIAKNFRYEYLGDEQDRSLANVTAVKKSDCGGLCILFIAAIRSQGIPAHALVGRWAISATHGKHGDSQEHVKGEFFAQGVGWVPVDLSSAILYDKSPEKLEYFGRDPGDHLAFCVDTGVPIDTHYFGVKTITWLQSACYWATGVGNFEGETEEEDWKVEATKIR
jgi:transglutaminase-like putative cysteine protease